MNWLNRFMSAYCSYVMIAFLLVISLICGVQIGQTRVQKAWDAEKLTIAVANAKQEQHVAEVKQSQTQITQEISNEFFKKSRLLADRNPVNFSDGMCDIPSAADSVLSAIPAATVGVAPASADSLFAAQRDTVGVSCAQLSHDAAQTTLMLFEIQRWYKLQFSKYQ